MSEEWNSLGKKLFSNQHENKQLCRRNQKLAMSLEKYKRVFTLKPKSRRLQKSWTENRQEDQGQQNKNNNNKIRTTTRSNLHLSDFMSQTRIMSKVSQLFTF